MSAIDQYKHRHLGFIECPSTFDIVNGNETRKVAIYELLENIPKGSENFDGKIGDIILGGGRGEVPAFRISIPEVINFFLKEGWDDFDNYEELFKAYWTPTQSYKLCDGYSKIGWTIENNIEFWLAKNLCSLLIDSIEDFSTYKNNTITKSELRFFSIAEV